MRFPTAVTRREALAGFAAGAAVLAAPSLGGRKPLGSVTGPAVPAGVTLGLQVFPRGTTMAAAMAEWAKVTGCRPLSTKVYLGHSEFPTSLKNNDKIAWCAKNDATCVICYEPAYTTFSKTDAAALEHSLAALKTAGLRHAAVVLWTEPIGFKRHLTPTQFKAGFKFYGTAAKSAGWPLYCCLNGFYQSEWAAYIPPNADGYAVDDYAARGNWAALFQKGGLAWMADRDGKKFGWFEMGASASKPVPKATVTAYMTAAGDLLAARKPGTTGPVIWYNGTGTGPGGLANTIVPLSKDRANNYMLPLYQKFYRKVTP